MIGKLIKALMIALVVMFILAYLGVINISRATNNGIEISTDFDSGGGMEVLEINDSGNYVKFNNAPDFGDAKADERAYFHFKISNVENRNITFFWKNYTDLSENTPPHFPPDYRVWINTGDLLDPHWVKSDTKVSDNGTFHHKFSTDTAYISPLIAYPYNRSIEFINQYEHLNHTTIESIGLSKEGRDMPVLRINEGQNRDIVVIARQHSHETIGSLHLEGMVDFVIDNMENPIVQRYTYHFIPAMSPDGMYHGLKRFCTEGIDLNREWEKTNPVQEVENAIRYLERNITNLIVGFDAHSARYLLHPSFYQGPGTEELASLLEPVISGHTGFSMSTSGQQARTHFTHLGALHSFTLEASDYMMYDDEQVLINEGWKMMNVTLNYLNEQETKHMRPTLALYLQ